MRESKCKRGREWENKNNRKEQKKNNQRKNFTFSQDVFLSYLQFLWHFFILNTSRSDDRDLRLCNVTIWNWAKKIVWTYIRRCYQQQSNGNVHNIKIVWTCMMVCLNVFHGFIFFCCNTKFCISSLFALNMYTYMYIYIYTLFHSWYKLGWMNWIGEK